MNSHIECDHIDVKLEDNLLMDEIKSEPHEIKCEVELETEECDVKYESYPNLPLISSTPNASWVDNTQESLERNFDEFIVKSKCEEHDKNEDETSDQHLNRDPCKISVTLLHKGKSEVDISGDMQRKANICRVTNDSVIKYNDVDTYTPSEKIHLKCNVCNKSLPVRSSITKYGDLLSGEESFTCNFCSNIYSEKHSNSHINGKRFTCNVCFKCFNGKSHLIEHTRIHTNEKPFTCDICLRSFAQKSNLNKHMRIHTNEKPFKCNVCMKSFTQKSNLTEHSRSHTREKPFTCTICMKSFSRSHHLLKHKRTHTNEKPFTCNVCNRSFSNRSQLIEHTRTHTNEKPFVCNVCLKSFRRRSHLNLHTPTHTNEKPFTCNICMKTFARRNELFRHMITQMKNDSHVK